MMPSHSMDLPVPRCTGILLLGGVKCGAQTAMQMFPVCVT